MNRQLRRELLEEYGRDAVRTAGMLVSLSDADAAWAMAMDEGLEDVADIIEELYMGGDDV